MRTTKKIGSQPITPETAAKLTALLDTHYPEGKWWREFAVCPVAVVHTVDNERDALQTIKNLEAKPLPVGAEKGKP